MNTCQDLIVYSLRHNNVQEDFNVIDEIMPAGARDSRVHTEWPFEDIAPVTLHIEFGAFTKCKERRGKHF